MAIRTEAEREQERQQQQLLIEKSFVFDNIAPDSLHLMAARVWPNLSINDVVYDCIRTSFFSGDMSDLDHELAANFIASTDSEEFLDWVRTVGTQYITTEITKNWLSDQTLNHDLWGRFRISMIGIFVIPNPPSNIFHLKRLHFGFILNGTNI